MSMSDNELARALFPKPRDVVSQGMGGAPIVTTAYGHAVSDSESGTVTIVLDGEAGGVDAEIDVPTGARILEGDQVMVTVSGTSPVDAVAAGWGDALMSDVQLSIIQNTDSLTLQIQGVQGAIETDLSDIQEQINDTNDNVDELSSTVDANMSTITSYMTFGQGESGGVVYPLLILGGGTNDQFSVRISNEMVGFMEESELVAYINNRQLYIKNANVTDGLTIGNWMWIPRANGNLSLKWVG